MRERTDVFAMARPAPAATRSTPGRSWYAIKNADSADEAEILIYNEIGIWGIEADSFVRELSHITAPLIRVRINSPGGNVFDGMTIYNALRRHPARIVSHVDGIAASIASVIALAGDEVLMGEGTFFMIHNPWMIAVGDAAELRDAADMVEKVEDTIVELYVQRTTTPEPKIREMMDAETWLTAAEAIDAGFADGMEDDAPAVEASFDLSRFKHVPRQLAARARKAPPATPEQRQQIATIREFESFLREEGGFSHAAAKAIASRGFRSASEPRDEDDDGLTDLAAALDRRGAALANLSRGN